MGCKNQFCIKVALHTNLHHASILHTLTNILIKQILSTCNTAYNVERIKSRKVRQLQHGHDKCTFNGHFHFRIALRNLDIHTLINQCKVITHWHFFFIILWVCHINQADAIVKNLDGITLCIAGGRAQRIRLRQCQAIGTILSTATRRGDDGKNNHQKGNIRFHYHQFLQSAKIQLFYE